MDFYSVAFLIPSDFTKTDRCPMFAVYTHDIIGRDLIIRKAVNFPLPSYDTYRGFVVLVWTANYSEFEINRRH